MNALTFSVTDAVATLTLDNPPQNRLSMSLMADFQAAIRQIQARPEIRAVLLQAKGEHFSFGGDITTWSDIEPGQMGEQIRQAFPLLDAFEQLPVPVISAVQGHCFGGGFELVLRTDIIVAADTAVFSHTEQTLGVVTLIGGVQRVAERAGRTRAARWALSAERVPAKEMLDAGVITEMVAPEALPARAAEWAQRLSRGATRAHAGHKRLLRAWSDGGVQAADRLLPEMTAELFATQDAKRGIRSAHDALMRGQERPAVEFNGH
jgi:enoyl-CoA hydratase/carnithine racemase